MSASDEPKVMKAEFRELLMKEKPPVQLIDYLEQENMLCAAVLAFYWDNRQQIMELLIFIDRVRDAEPAEVARDLGEDP